MILPVKVNVTRSPRRPGTPRQAFFTKWNDAPLTSVSANRVSADEADRLTGPSGFVAAQPKYESLSFAFALRFSLTPSFRFGKRAKKTPHDAGSSLTRSLESG